MRLSAEQRRALLADPRGWIACGFGSGLSPIAPGTAGSLAALFPYLLLRELRLPFYLAFLVVAFALGVWVSAYAVRKLRIADPGVIVWDEFVGQWLALALAPHDWKWIIIGFILFRLFDVWKPWPVSWADRTIKGGLGVMLDDVLAGLYAATIVAATAAIVQRW
jgi:phosphatidylglycerophosphatase A